MAKKGKGFFGSIGSFLGSIPAVGKVKNAAKSVKKKIKNTKKKLKKAIKKAKKKLKKKLKKKIGKVFTKARKLKNNLSKSKMVKKFKRTAKKVVLAAKQAAKKTYTKVKQAVKEVKATVKKAVVVYKSLDKIEPPKPTKDMSTKERLLLAGMEIGLHKAQKMKGEFDATFDLAKNTFEGIKEFAKNPIGVIKEKANNIGYAVSHPDETLKSIESALKNSYETFNTDVINGNAYSKSYWLTNAKLTTATAVVGTKGAGSLTKVGKIPTPTKFPTKRIDSNADQHVIDKVANARGQLSNKYKEKGNFAYAEVNIAGVNKKDFYAHSKIQDGKKNIPGTEEFSFKTDNPIFKATKAPDKGGDYFLRDVDTEYKILNDLAERIGTNYEAKGTIKLFTEKDTCDSCNLIIQQFDKKYPNISIEVIHNGDKTISPNNN